jgi:hypothetical protein
MPKYHVLVREVYVSTVEIIADNEKDAIEKVSQREGEEIDCEYSRTLDEDTWEVKLLSSPEELTADRLDKL